MGLLHQPQISFVDQFGGLKRQAAAFPAQAGNVTVIAFSASKRIGVERAETLLAYWLGEGEAPGQAVAAEAIKKGPRGQGE
jgi:hypothetical protein